MSTVDKPLFRGPKHTFDMAQKRNPVSLRLQTRLQGHEKRFASCWFTDSFFSQVYGDDLVKRLYLGHLLQKGGSWYGEVSESRIPETCISIQFLYRRCSIFSVVLDRRKEEYVLENLPKGVKSRAESLLTHSRKKDTTPRIAGEIEISDIVAKSTDLATDSGASGQIVPIHSKVVIERDNASRLSGNTYHAASTERAISTDRILYLSIANRLEIFAGKYKRRATFISERWDNDLAGSTNIVANAKDKAKKNYPSTDKDERDRYSCLYSQIASQRDWRDWLKDWKSSQKDNTIQDSVHLSTIESTCNSCQEMRETQSSLSLLDTQKDNHFVADNRLRSTNADGVEGKEGLITVLTPTCHWSSYSFIRGVSATQNIEFCLYSVASLYKKRLSFLQIKETLFKMLAADRSVRGARLVCSGRQGGRSKSAMRAKKQSALWGQTALSLFCSRLAFASTSVETSFGQIGIKIWICYR